jgi:hypothetical protein
VPVNILTYFKNSLGVTAHGDANSASGAPDMGHAVGANQIV